MNGTMPEREPAAAAPDVNRLQESFRVFTQVTRSLEHAYKRLETRAGGMDPRLRDANKRLSERVAELQRAGDELNGILDAIPCGIVVCGDDLVIRRVNPEAERILGRPAHELCGRDARALLDHAGQPLLLLGRAEFTVGQTVDRRVGCLDGSMRSLSGSVALLEEHGRLEIVTDQTEVAHLRTQVNRLDTLAALGEMAAGVAHEIRNPMSAVEGFAGLLEKAIGASPAPPAAQLLRYADRIRRGVAEVNGIISSLLMWARPEKLQVHAFALEPLLAEIAGELRDAARGACPALELRVEPRDLAVRADRLKLKLAVANVLRNAVEAAGPEGRVEASAGRDERGAWLTIDDDGPGLPPEVTLRLFRPFATTKPDGTGLGLALAKKFVELHGGDLAASPSPLGGARFTLILPPTQVEAAGA